MCLRNYSEQGDPQFLPSCSLQFSREANIKKNTVSPQKKSVLVDSVFANLPMYGLLGPEQNITDGWFKQNFIFSSSWRLQVQNQSAGKFHVWRSLSSLLADDQFLIMSSHDLFSTHLQSLIRTPVLLG